MSELGGRKSLYSTSFYSEDEFWRLYNGPAYETLKKSYDPGGRLLDLYAKCVGRTVKGSSVSRTGIASGVRAGHGPVVPPWVTAYDGSTAGPADAEVRVELKTADGAELPARLARRARAGPRLHHRPPRGRTETSTSP